MRKMHKLKEIESQKKYSKFMSKKPNLKIFI